MPAGDWTILRLGHTPTGATTARLLKRGRGLECDKLSREAFDAHWAGSMAKIIQDLGPLAGKTLNNCLIDSYEMGGQNWTPRFREEFTRRRGYDPLLSAGSCRPRMWNRARLPNGSCGISGRTIADLFATTTTGYFAETCRKNGLEASIEPYDGPFECLQVGPTPISRWVSSGSGVMRALRASWRHRSRTPRQADRGSRVIHRSARVGRVAQPPLFAQGGR